MSKWVVVTADARGAGRGVRGLALVWFLRTYFGRRAVRSLTPTQLLAKERVSAETLLIGLPTSLTAEQILELRDRTGCRRIATFDYFDQLELAWEDAQAGAFRELTDLYLKPWYEPAWATLPAYQGLRMGLLPVRRYGRFTWARRFDRWLGRRAEPSCDVAFLGRPNETRFFVNGKVELVEQRVEWMLDLKRSAPDLKFWGGLVGVEPWRRDELREKYDDVEELFYQGSKVNFTEYYRNISRSRVLLAPGGNVPWTYRHYESLYAGAAVVTVDFRLRDMLTPLPRDGMVHVPDGESVVPAVREALEMFERRPQLGAENIAFLEKFLRDGTYSRSQQLLIERFEHQLEPL